MTLSPEEHRRVTDCFDTLLALPHDERAAHLDDQSLPEHVRAEVESLLQLHEAHAGAFLDSPALGKSLDDLASAARRRSSPIDVGPYRLFRPLPSLPWTDDHHAVRQRVAPRGCALRLLRTSLAQDDAARARLDAERESLAALEHPAFPRLLDIGESERRGPYLVRERIDGPTLRTHLEKKAPNRRERLRLFDQIVAAVADAHSLRIALRLLTPDTIAIDRFGQARIHDLGAAAPLALAASDDRLSDLRTDPPVLDILAPWLSPELTRSEPADLTADVYALALVLHFLFSESNPTSSDAPEPKLIPRRLRCLYTQATDPAPHRRHANAADLLAELRRHARIR